jgi:outer membrane protein insertion porin family
MRQRAGIALWTSVILILLVLSGNASAQDNPRVIQLDVIGNRVTTPSLIMGVSSIDLGSPLTQTAVQESIRRLYSLGLFSDVRIDAREVPGGVHVYIVVTELPKLIGLDFAGNDKIDSRDLKEKLGLGVGGYISPYLVNSSVNKIKDLYSEKGYFQAVVEPELTYQSDSTEASLLFRIDERSKVKVEKVVVTGNDRVEAGDLVGKMRNRKRGFLKSSDFAQDKYEEDLEKVIAEHHKKGFIDAYLISDSMRIDTATNRMTIFLEVYEGPKYYFGTSEFSGNENLAGNYLKSRLKHKEDDVFNKEKYDESLFEVYSAYQDIGHLHIRIADGRTTRNDSILDITYDISEGLPSHINLVNIVGNSKTKDHVIRREISSMPGQVFNRTLLMRSVRDVMALNYFANVEPVPIDLPNGDVDLEFKVEEKQTGQVSAGAGYNSQDKVVGTVGIGIPNFRGMGQSLSFNVDFGSRRNSFSISFTEPWLFGRPTLLGIDLFSLNRDWFDDYTESRQGGSLRLGRRLRWPDNYFRVVGAFRIERTRFTDFDSLFATENSFTTDYWFDTNESGNIDAGDDLIRSNNGPFPGSILELRGDWKSSIRAALTITRDSRNLPEFATRGSRVSYTFTNVGGPLGGFWNFQKHELSLAKFFPIVGNLALAAKIEFGAINAPKGDDKIFISDRFTPGGTAFDGVVRGYDDGDLTPDSLLTEGDTTYFFLDPTADPAVTTS